MTYSCSSSPYTYAPAGHVVTGNLKIITDYALRKLIMKGPSYREQNNIPQYVLIHFHMQRLNFIINWNLNLKMCKEAVVKYRNKWAKRSKVDKRVLSEWENAPWTVLRIE